MLTKNDYNAVFISVILIVLTIFNVIYFHVYNYNIPEVIIIIIIDIICALYYWRTFKPYIIKSFFARQIK